MTPDEFKDLVILMLDKQQAYFKAERNTNEKARLLEESKALEKRVRTETTNREPSLF